MRESGQVAPAVRRFAGAHRRLCQPLYDPDASTPLMRQYNAIKQQVPNALLMFRLGDFYELFFEDAVTAARELEITLTSRNKEKGAAIPMCGVPYHAAEGYIARLIQKGYRVAICDQMEDPALAKKLVKREITRIVTPGTAMDANLRPLAREQLPGRRGARRRRAPAWPTSIFPPASSASPKWTPPKSPARSNNWVPARCCSPPNCRCSRAKSERSALSSAPSSKTGSSPPITPAARCATTSSCFRSMAAAWPTAPPPWPPPAPSCITCAIPSAPRSNTSTGPLTYDRADRMVLDAVTVRNLELVEPLFAGEAQATPRCWHVLDQTLTGMGGRLLRQRLLRPSLDPRRDRGPPGRRSASCCSKPSCAPNCASN